MDEIVKLSMLLEIYKNLITEKQRDVLNLYYNQDLSLAEMADEFGISRQAVRDNIKNGEKNLLKYEEQMKLLEKKIKASKIFDELEDELENLKQNLKQNNNVNAEEKIKGIIAKQKRLREIMEG